MLGVTPSLSAPVQSDGDGAPAVPRLDDAETFECIIASDVIYQKEDVKPIVVSMRSLKLGGG